MKIENSKLKIFQSRSGQSLIEVLIGLAIGAVLIGAASLGVTFMLRSSASNQNVQIGTSLAQDLVDKVRTVAASDWRDIYDLTKGTSTSYFVNASGTQLIIVEGQEGVISNENTNGLVAHWKMDESTSTATTTTFDASGNANHGTFVGAPARATSTCRVSNCLSFDGVDDRVSISTPLNNFPTSTITVSAWVKVPNHVNWYDYVRNNWPGVAGAWLLYSDSFAVVRFGVIDDALAQHNASGCASAFTTNTWHMVTGTYDGSTVMVYVDGAQCATTNALSGQSLYTGGTIQFGEWGSAGATTHYIDDVRIYNRALSADEIQRLWNSVAFTRYFNVANVNRDTNGNIVSSGGNEDPSTQKATVTVEWPGSGTNIGQIQLIDYLTRWQNDVFQQTDWLGGSGQTGPITTPNSRYDSATSVSNPAGSIRIQGL